MLELLFELMKYIICMSIYKISVFSRCVYRWALFHMSSNDHLNEITCWSDLVKNWWSYGQLKKGPLAEKFTFHHRFKKKRKEILTQWNRTNDWAPIACISPLFCFSSKSENWRTVIHRICFYLWNCFPHSFCQTDTGLLSIQKRLNHIQWRCKCWCYSSSGSTGKHMHQRIVFSILVQLEVPYE